MIRVEMYTQDFCGYCVSAKKLIEKKIRDGMFFDLREYNIMLNGQHKKDLKERLPEAKTVPQIFFNDGSIGGYEDLVEYIDNHTSFG